MILILQVYVDVLALSREALFLVQRASRSGGNIKGRTCTHEVTPICFTVNLTFSKNIRIFMFGTALDVLILLKICRIFGV